MKRLKLKFVADPRITHKALLRLLGEVDGISVDRIANEGATIVTLHIAGKSVVLIKDYATNLGHHITRSGIAQELRRAGFNVNGE